MTCGVERRSSGADQLNSAPPISYLMSGYALFVLFRSVEDRPTDDAACLPSKACIGGLTGR